MLAIPDEHLLKFHACKDAKSLWEAIKNRFGGNKESKKMKKTILKQNYENFTASSEEGMPKTCDRFQKLTSQIEIHGEVISQEDANLKLLRSLPSAWNNIALIMRNKSNLDTLSMDDLYNNLKVYESEIKGQSSSSSNSHNVAFVSLYKSISTNESVNYTHSGSAASSKDQASTASYADDNDTDDLDVMDLKWQVAMVTMRVNRFIKKTGSKLDLNGKDTVGFDMTKVKCYNCHKRGHFARECRALRNQGNRNRDAPTRNAPVDTYTTNALVVQDEIGGYDWSFQAEEELKNFALMAYTSQGSSSSDSESLKSVRNALKEKDDLKLKLEKFETSSKNLTKLVNSQISTIDKTGLGYDDQMNESDLNDIYVNESEVLNNVIDSRKSNRDDNQVNDRFKKVEGYHAVPPSYTRNYMPPRADLSFDGLDNYVFKSKVSETITSVPKTKTNASKTSKDSLEKPKTVRNTTVENKNKDEKPRKFSQSLRGNKRNWNDLVTQKLRDGFEFKKKACFVYGSINHLIKDYDFYENNMDQGTFDSGCSKHMTGNKSYLTDYQEINGRFELKFNLFSVSQMCDKKNSVLFTDTKCVVLSPDFKLLDESQLLLKDTLDESNLWHKRLGYINFKTINKLLRGNIVSGLPSKLFENDHTCVACQNEKQHKSFFIKPHNKTPYELFLGREPTLSFMRLFGCPITILNTLDHLGNQTNGNACTKANINVRQAGKKTVPGPQYVLLLLLTSDSQAKEGHKNDQEKDLKDHKEAFRKQFEQESERLFSQREATNTNSTNRLNTISSLVNAASSSFTNVDLGRDRAQRSEFQSMSGQDKEANGNRMFNLVSATGSTYVNLGGSIPINVTTLPNADLPTDPLMPDLKDTADL
uniref:CCHC-type domain-containing protein n=1 Tax=Tanacetum cinerariifolium TaxID=118510 RepID=A0A699GSR6_TANCI|nr:hypothetical protein [Tanacetum cinerariifolium]